MRDQSNDDGSQSRNKFIGPSPMSDDTQMAKFGITVQTTHIYFYGKYRYTSLQDALAQARRDIKAGVERI